MPADFATIDSAISAASSGDTIVVATGSYAGFTLRGKGLSIVAGKDADVTIGGAGLREISNVLDVPAGERCSVRGLSFIGTDPGNLYPLLSVGDCAGSVWLEDLRTNESDSRRAIGPLSAAPTINIARCSDVVCLRTRSRGTHGHMLNNFSFALRIVESRVFLHGCVLNGGQARDFGGIGAHGVEIFRGVTIFRDCDVNGGDGSDGRAGIGLAGYGGSGLSMLSNAYVRLVGTQVTGGLGGRDHITGVRRFQVRAIYRTRASDLGTMQATPTRLSTTASALTADPVQSTSVDLDLMGQAGAAVILITDSRPQTSFLPGLPGFFGLGAGATLQWTAPLDSKVSIPPLPAGSAPVDLLAQCVTLSSEVNISNPVWVTVHSPR